MKHLLILFAIPFLWIQSVFAQNLKGIEFREQKITDILTVLAEETGISVITDDTVDGTASFFFSKTSAADALQNFLGANGLYSTENGGVLKISRIKCEAGTISGTFSLSADDVPPEKILKALAKKAKVTILTDTLPGTKISIDAKNMSVEQLIDVCIKKFDDYTAVNEENCHYVKKITTADKKTAVLEKKKQPCIKRDGELYCADTEYALLSEILKELMDCAQKEYSCFFSEDAQITNLHFADKDFETMLSLILERAKADFAVSDGIYYIIDSSRKGIRTRVQSAQIFTPVWISAQDIPSFIRSDSEGAGIIVSKTGNSVLLTGTKSEIECTKRFIESVDKPSENMYFERLELKHLKARDAVALIPQKFLVTQPVNIPGTNALLLSGSRESIKRTADFLKTADVALTSEAVTLKYIQSAELLENLPPSVQKEDIRDSGFPNTVFFTGSRESREIFLKELEHIDRPKPQIRYQILVVQYSKNKSGSYRPDMSVSYEKPQQDSVQSTAESFIFAGDLSNIMALSFDVISKFGYQFAASLNAQIGNSTANIFTDTTLTGISGQEVRFQNTDTYRYMEYEYDKSTETATAGTTQHITSGLIVGLNGWVSGDNMITINVNATVSKQNTDSSSGSSSLTALPSTSERVVNTQVRTPSGEPVIISGLIKDDTVKTENKTSLLSAIPLLGKLFTQKAESREKTEIVIYIVPHLIHDYKDTCVEERIKRYYKNAAEKIHA